MSETTPKTLTMTPMARFSCGRYEIEVMADVGSFRWTRWPDEREVKTLDDLRAMVVVGTAALNWKPSTRPTQETDPPANSAERALEGYDGPIDTGPLEKLIEDIRAAQETDPE